MRAACNTFTPPQDVTRSVLRAFSTFRPRKYRAPCQPDAPNAKGRNRTLVSGFGDRGSATELPTHEKTGGRPSAAGDVSRGRPRGGRTPAYAVVGLSAVSGISDAPESNRRALPGSRAAETQHTHRNRIGVNMRKKGENPHGSRGRKGLRANGEPAGRYVLLALPRRRWRSMRRLGTFISSMPSASRTEVSSGMAPKMIMDEGRSRSRAAW